MYEHPVVFVEEVIDFGVQAEEGLCKVLDVHDQLISLLSETDVHWVEDVKLYLHGVVLEIDQFPAQVVLGHVNFLHGLMRVQ